MQKTVVIDLVGLSSSLIGSHTPFLKKWKEDYFLTPVSPMLPSVTTSVQSTYLTGQWPSDHGIVSNGWYDREDKEIKFWKQSNSLVQSPKIWDRAKNLDPTFTCSNMFWWYNMYSTVDFSVTPRPNYLADGRKIPDCYSQPSGLRDYLQRELGTFPLFQFWGPGADIRSTEWIAQASMLTEELHSPTLTLIYLPHLDYCLQKFGPDFSMIDRNLEDLDRVCANLVKFYEQKNAQIILLSEYGITPVDHPVHINRILRKNGFLEIRTERGLEILDPGASRAFAVADHQLAHIYINESSCKRKIKQVLEGVPGIEQIMDREDKRKFHLSHERSGDLILVAEEKSWFTYYYWLEDKKAPDFARLVDIHHKPGYDPVEMFMDPSNPLIKFKAAYKLLRKKLGFRYLMNVIPLNADLIKGSHGRIGSDQQYHPVLMTRKKPKMDHPDATDIYSVIWQHLTG
ncbi:MAG: alkaline phosphatase family protein [Chitinophagaceae bacterium]